jgi:hypothetical protein
MAPAAAAHVAGYVGRDSGTGSNTSVTSALVPAYSQLAMPSRHT